MRISTNALHARAVETLLAQQTALSRTQEQVSSGRRLLSPADDPAAAVHIMRLERALAQSAQFERNAAAAETRLALEEQAVADVANTLQRVRELVVQANTATADAAARAIIATEIEQRLGELIDIANRRDANGEYLFAGYSSLSAPFARAGGSVTYTGDQGARYIQIGPTQRVADGHSGYEVFLAIPEGNGTFVTEASGANTGSGIIDGGAVIDAAAWGTGGDYTLRFTSPTAWEVTDAGGNPVASGAYQPGGSIEFSGVRVTVTGEPASGDSFSIARSRTEDIFTTLRGIADALRARIDTPAEQAAAANALGGALLQLDQALDHLSNVRAEIGARLATLESTGDARADHALQLEQALSELRDLDYAEAVSRMNRQLVGLQAAQLSYSRISQLSLFSFL